MLVFQALQSRYFCALWPSEKEVWHSWCGKPKINQSNELRKALTAPTILQHDILWLNIAVDMMALMDLLQSTQHPRHG
jgi:hypothetical protein